MLSELSENDCSERITSIDDDDNSEINDGTNFWKKYNTHKRSSPEPSSIESDLNENIHSK